MTEVLPDENIVTDTISEEVDPISKPKETEIDEYYLSWEKWTSFDEEGNADSYEEYEYLLKRKG